MAESIILKGALGNNNKIDPLRHSYNTETGVGFLSVADNCDIDDSNMISRRLGRVLISSKDSHSLFCVGGDGFVVQNRGGDAALYKIGPNKLPVGVRSGLTEFANMSYFQVGLKTFYANGFQNGVVTNGVSAPWPIDEYKGPDSLKDFSAAPVGTHIAYFGGMAWIAVGSTIYCSIPYKLGLFRMAKYFFNFATDIRMIRPVAGGVWISDSKNIGFIAVAETWDGYKYFKRSDCPAHEWSDNNRLVDLSKAKVAIPGLSAVWSSDEGLCAGTADGQLINLTDDRLVYSAGSSGATVIDKFNVINTVY